MSPVKSFYDHQFIHTKYNIKGNKINVSTNIPVNKRSYSDFGM